MHLPASQVSRLCVRATQRFLAALSDTCVFSAFQATALLAP